MLGATSLLKGDYTPVSNLSKQRRRRLSQKNRNAAQETIRSSPTTRFSTTLNSSEVAISVGGQQQQQSETADDSDDVGTSTSETFSSCTEGSTGYGDSFVLAIDWEMTTGTVGSRYYHETKEDDDKASMYCGHKNGLNDSLEDPYLPPMESVRQRLFCNSNNPRRRYPQQQHHAGTVAARVASATRSRVPCWEPALPTSFAPNLRSNSTTLNPSPSIRSVRNLLGGSSPAGKVKGSLELHIPSPYHPAVCVMEATSVSTTASAVKSLGSFAMPNCQATPVAAATVWNSAAAPSLRRPSAVSSCLGSFDFPTTKLQPAATAMDADDDGFETALEHEEMDHVLTSVKVPGRARFEASNVSTTLFHMSDRTSSDEEESVRAGTSLVESGFVIPSMPVLTKAPAPSRKRYHVARLRITELKAKLEAEKRSLIVVSPTGGTAVRTSPKRLQMARYYLDLGTLEQQLHQYPSAINSFFHAAAIFRHLDRPVALATALDCAALAYCHAHEEGSTSIIHRQHKVARFFRCLHEALKLRKQELGPWHVDTVDTFQHLAKLLLLTGQATEAARTYLEVVQLRKAIFGPHHAGTAVTAHCLGNAYFQSHDTVAAEIWYDHAWDVYQFMELPLDNPAVVKLSRDRKRLERVERWITEEDPADDENLLFEL